MFKYFKTKKELDEQLMKEREELYTIVKSQQDAIKDLTKSIELLAKLCAKEES